MVWNPLEEIALLIGVTAAFAYFNHYLLRLPKKTLYDKMKRLGISTDSFKAAG